MKRRTALASLAGGGTLLGSGCLSVIVDTPEPVHFELWNRTDESHEVSVTIRDGDDVVLDEAYDIEDASAGPAGGNVIREDAIAEATNGTSFDVEATLDGRIDHDHRFEVQCNGRDPANLFLIEIESGREANLAFDQSRCG